jgi:hypothetical protein
MRSVNDVTGKLKKVLIGGLMVAAFGAMPANAGLVAGGSVPLENYYMAVGNSGVDVTSANAALATGVLGTIYINNNAANSFTLNVTQTYGGFLRTGLAAGLPVIATGTGNPFTATDIIHSATPDAGEVKGFTAGHLAATALVGAAGGTIAYSPGAATVASVNYSVDIRATWIAAPALLAGFYAEKFTISLIAVM